LIVRAIHYKSYQKVVIQSTRNIMTMIYESDYTCNMYI